MNFWNPYQQQYYQPPAFNPFSQQQGTQQQVPQPAPAPQQPSNGVNWVQGEAGAKAYMVAPGASVILMDSEAQAFYLKSCDQQGVPALRIFDYTERTVPVAAPQLANSLGAEYVTRKEFEELVKRLRHLDKEREGEE